MDKNTITGLVLIGILLVGFSFLSRPSEEQIAAQKKYYDSIAVVQQPKRGGIGCRFFCFVFQCLAWNRL